MYYILSIICMYSISRWHVSTRTGWIIYKYSSQEGWQKKMFIKCLNSIQAKFLLPKLLHDHITLWKNFDTSLKLKSSIFLKHYSFQRLSFKGKLLYLCLHNPSKISDMLFKKKNENILFAYLNLLWKLCLFL